MRFTVFSGLTICLAISGWNLARTANWPPGLFASAASVNEAREVELDQNLQRAANAALGDRRGAIIVMDPQTGRVRAVVNSQLAFEETVRPGSTIKPFTALAALKAGLIDDESRAVCRETYTHDAFHTSCSHPRDLAPFNPTEAIAYSCNYYFGKLGEKLSEPSFTPTLTEFGFGKLTGINVEHEARGQLLHQGWRSENAIGETDNLQATPIQLINAYAALVNGGHLFTPRVASARDYTPELRATVTINNDYRALIVKGMRGAVRYGSAETARLYSLPIYTFGKTGTATQINGFRTQGLFVGFASQLPEDAREADAQAPENIKLAVLVFLAKAHGSDAAEIARPVFAEFARAAVESGADSEKRVVVTHQGESVETNGVVESRPRSQSPASSQVVTSVRVHLVSENETRTLALEDYVRGVVATEGSMESESEALKALAIAARTYALKNMGRHAQDGFDFCTTTHCQRFRSSNANTDNSLASEAVESTRGEVLIDDSNQLADSYFGASCGGATANINTLWGVSFNSNGGKSAPGYLRGVQDEYCVTEQHHAWADTISRPQLLKALQSDPRTNVGSRLLNVSVARRDESGRAELITIEGDRRVTVKGWDFKIIVGRALGWNLLKSSRFEVAQQHSGFVFRGSGFGHGLGLCQEGAHVMAARGANYRRILAKYFPTTRITNEGIAAAADLIWSDEVAASPSEIRFNFGDSYLFGKANRRTLRSEYFGINYPDSVKQGEIERLLDLLQSSRQSLLARTMAAGVNTQFPALDVFINETTGDFVGRTGQPPWAAAATKGRLVELQPIATLRRRGILETTLRHELVHAVVESIGRGRTPRWLAEGLAINFAGEGPMVTRFGTGARMTTGEIEQKLQHAKSASDMKQAYAAAYAEVRRLINSEGEAGVWRRAAK